MNGANVKRGVWRVVSAMSTVTLVASACGGTDDRRDDAASSSPAGSNPPARIDQPEPGPGAVAETDPLAAMRDGIYSLLRRAGSNPVRLAGYRALTMPNPDSAVVRTFTPTQTGWQQQSYDQLVFSPPKASWVTDDRTQKVELGPTGSRGWPTVKSEGAQGITYTTYASTDLAGRPLTEGIDPGWSENAALPATVTTATFSPGARSYVETVTAADPTYLIDRIRIPNENTERVMPVFACDDPDYRAPCATPATGIDDAISRRGKYYNSTKTGQLNFTARAKPTGSSERGAMFVGEGSPVAEVLDVKVVTDDGPPRITFGSLDPAVAKKFEKLFRTSLENFALYGYDGQVVSGGIQPAGTTRTNLAGYNRVAADDLLTRWDPPLPPISP